MQVFPVVTPGRARALSLFFEWLAEQGLSWGRMSNYRAAIRSLSWASGVPDPWDRYPVLRDMAEGMKKRRTVRAEQKEGATLQMVLDVLEHLRESERHYREEGKTRLADCALRNQVSVIFSYVGMRRGAEI
eukprot:485019-Rhodomonas_salina.1